MMLLRQMEPASDAGSDANEDTLVANGLTHRVTFVSLDV